jgi:uncharacterized cupredoxin-like copper-binding protein
MMRSPAAVLAFLALSEVPSAVLAQPAAPQVVTVQLASFSFSPSELALQRGHAYRLHLVNGAGGGHDFSAPQFFAASLIAPEDRAKVVGGKVRLKGKQAIDITLTPQTAGTYKLTCTHFMHTTFGMTGRIVVS